MAQKGSRKTQIKPLTLGQQSQQEYVETGREMRASTKKIDCTEEAAWIDTLLYDYERASIDEKAFIFDVFGKISCPRVITFLENIIDKDTAPYHYEAIRCLGWLDAQSSIPFLLERAGRSTLSSYEKICIASVFAVLEDWENAEKLLNAHCFTTEPKFCNKCIWAYYKLGNESAKKYYRYIIKNTSSPGFQNQCAQRLADLGDEKTTFPIFEKILETQTEEYIRKGALAGLEVLETRRSVKMIQKYSQDPDPEIRKFVKGIQKNRAFRLQKSKEILK